MVLLPALCEGGIVMIKLYTAIGNYTISKDGQPIIITSGRECALSVHELLLWSSLAFRILTHQELRAEFYRKERELHILGELDFEDYLNRLIARRLIVSGRDETGVDALYDLLGHLYVQIIPSNFCIKLPAFFKLLVKQKMSLRNAALVFRSEKLDPSEKQVMTLLKHQMLSTAEIIQCAAKGKKKLQNSQELMKCLYENETTDCENIVIDSRTTDIRIPVLSAIANLYLKQYITFQIL